jgi:hypothetical protein
VAAQIAGYPCAGDSAYFSGDLLNSDHERKAEYESPSETVAKLRANLAMRANPAWIVVRSACDEARPQASQESSQSTGRGPTVGYLFDCPISDFMHQRYLSVHPST